MGSAVHARARAGCGETSWRAHALECRTPSRLRQPLTSCFGSQQQLPLGHHGPGRACRSRYAHGHQSPPCKTWYHNLCWTSPSSCWSVGQHTVPWESPTTSQNRPCPAPISNLPGATFVQDTTALLTVMTAQRSCMHGLCNDVHSKGSVGACHFADLAGGMSGWLISYLHSSMLLLHTRDDDQCFPLATDSCMGRQSLVRLQICRLMWCKQVSGGVDIRCLYHDRS